MTELYDRWHNNPAHPITHWGTFLTLSLVLTFTLLSTIENFYGETPVVEANNHWTGLIDPSRAIDWSQAGIPGGIPDRTNICATIDPGASTVSIQTAINNCPANGVVFFSAGTHTLTSSLTSNKGVVLRGAGPNATTLVLNGNIIFSRSPGSGGLGGEPGPRFAVDWTGGYEKGATTIMVASTTNLSVGQEIILDQLNDTSVVSVVGNAGTCGVTANSCGRNGTNFSGGGNTRAMFQLVRITSIDGNNLTIDTPLYYTYRSDLSPQIFFWANGNIKNAGVEDLKIDAQSNDFAINLSWCSECWVKNVRVENLRRAAVHMNSSYRNEIRDNYFAESLQAGPTNYGVELSRTSASLIENNIFLNITAPILLESSAGNVIGYNYSLNTIPGWMFSALTSHLSHNWMNLFEGNSADQSVFDVVWGSASHQTMFRNRLTGHHANKSNNRVPIVIQAWNRFNNVIGNVLGTDGYHTRYQVNRDVTGGNDNFIYSIGYWANWYNGLDDYDDLAYSTLMRWGNFDYVSDSTRWDTGEIPDGLPTPTQTLPVSLYKSGKPDYFANVAWPPIGPDVSGLFNKIPAEICFEQGAMPNCLISSPPTEPEPEPEPEPEEPNGDEEEEETPTSTPPVISPPPPSGGGGSSGGGGGGGGSTQTQPTTPTAPTTPTSTAGGDLESLRVSLMLQIIALLQQLIQALLAAGAR